MSATASNVFMQFFAITNKHASYLCVVVPSPGKVKRSPFHLSGGRVQLHLGYVVYSKYTFIPLWSGDCFFYNICKYIHAPLKCEIYVQWGCFFSYEPNNLHLNYPELLRKSSEAEINISGKEIEMVEQVTRTQAKGPGIRMEFHFLD